MTNLPTEKRSLFSEVIKSIKIILIVPEQMLFQKEAFQHCRELKHPYVPQ